MNNQLVTSLTAVYEKLTNFSGLEEFWNRLNTIFGSEYNSVLAQSLRSQWQNQDFSQFPQIEIRSSQEINGALGAFSRDTNRIYLAQEFISKNQSHPEIIAQVLLEEIGHWVDSRINVADAPGDEGEIFSDLVQGQILNDEKLQYLRGKNDVATVVIDGQLIQIEQASTGWISGGFEGSQKTLKLDSKGGGIVQYSYEMYGIPDDLILRYEGKDILNTGYVSGDKTGTVQIPKGDSDELQVILATNDEGTAWNYIVETINNEVNIKDAYVAVEGGSSKTATIKFTVTLSKASTVATTVQYMTLIGTAVDVDGKKAGKDGIDYQPVKGTVTFAPGETTKDIGITVIGDEPVNYAKDKNFEIFARDTAYRDWTGKEGQDIDEKLTDKDKKPIISPYGDLGYRVNQAFGTNSPTGFQAVGLTSDEKFFVLISDPTNAEISKDSDAEKNRLLTELAKNFGTDQSSPAYIEAKKQIDKQIAELQAQKASWTFATGTIYDKGKPPVLALRGTEPSSKDIWADANPVGVGFNQFEAGKDSVEKWLKEDVSNPKDTNVSFKPDITGHSLGGALTQWVAADYSLQGSLGDIVTFNSPGISAGYADSFKSAESVTHYVTSIDVVSMAGTKYIPGQYVLSNYLSGINVGFEHTHPVIIGKNYRTCDEKPPSLLPEAAASSTQLSNPLFTYLPDPDYFAFQLVVAGAGNLLGTPLGLPVLGSYLAKQLTFRGTTELNRKLIGVVLYGSAAIGEVYYKGILLDIAAIDFAYEFAKENIQAGWNASKKWVSAAAAWTAITTWDVAAWTAATTWKAVDWTATTAWKAVTWTATITWSVATWTATTTWSAATWVAVGAWDGATWAAVKTWDGAAWAVAGAWDATKWAVTTTWSATAWAATAFWDLIPSPFSSNLRAEAAVRDTQISPQQTQINSGWEAISHWSPEAWQATTHWSDAAWQATTQWTLDTWQATTQWSDETWKSTTQWTDAIWQATAKLDGTSGDQLLFGTIGNDNLIGGSGNDILDGLDGNDTLAARDGNDIIQGGSGNDTLTGGTGNDNFVFNSPTDGVDTITDFENGGIDQIVISAQGFGGGLTPDAFLQQSQFVLGTTAADGDDRFIYDPATGNLFFDPDGTGNRPQQLIATLAGVPNLSASDIFISGNSTTPSIQITAPDTDINGKEVTIQWNAFDADSIAKISLFYDTDDQGFDGILIADGLAETDGEGSFVWNTENVPQEDYFIYAKIVDEKHSPVFNYSKGQVKLKPLEVADLSVTQTTSATSVGLGENLTYTIKVTNNSLVASKGVTLVETLPEEVTFTSASLTPSEQTDNVLTFDLGDLAAGNSKTITINITTSSLLTGTITSDAVVLSQTLDPDITQNVSSVSTEVIAPALPDLTITRIDTSGVVDLNVPYSYNLIITNNGSIAATGVVLTDILPSDVNYISTNTTVPLSVSGSIVTGNLGTVNPGESKTLNLNLASFVAGNLIGTTNVTSNETDSNPLDNLIVSRKTVSATAPSPADLTLIQAVDNLNPNVGSQVTFTLTLTNKGPNIASGIQVTDLLPNGLSFISATPEQGTYDYKTGVWDVGNMKNGLSRTLGLVAKVNQSSVIVNKAELTAANEPDPNSTHGNNNPNEDDQASVTINIPNEAPTDLSLSNSNTSENQSIGTTVGDFTTTDSNAGDTFTYSWVTGNGDTDNSKFTITGNQLKTSDKFDFETKNSYSIRVKTTDKSGLSYEKPFTITVTDVNEAPTNLALSKTSIAENQPIGSTVGDFTTTDPDTGNTFSYSLVTGTGSTDNSQFTIVGNQLKAKPSFDFETKNSYSVRVKTTDKSGLSYEKPFTITVTDVNEAPTDILFTKQPASGNLPIGTILGNFSSVDPDSGQIFTYSLVNGLGNTNNSLFTVVGKEGQLKTNIPLDTAQSFDFSIRVRTTDQGGLFFDKIIEIKKISGGGWGDVHLRTFDGLWYDQQSFGDFILVKSTVDDWQIQTRQKPWIYNSNVSVNTSFATTVDGHRVLFDKFLDDDKKLKIDENQVTLTSGQSLNIGSSKISRQGNSYTLIYAGKDGILSTGDDDQLIAQDNGSYVDINVLPSNDRVGLLQGFLGNADGIISNDFTLRSGTLLSSNPTWEQIHGVWAESWRVLESESLFTTPPPSQGTPPKIILGDLDAKDVQDAKDIGIKLGLPDAALNAAALDFALTKDITFLNNAANLFSPKFSISSSSIAEGDKDSSSVRLFVQLSTSSKRTVTVDYATQDGTGLNKAIAGSDYTATSGTLTLTFLPGTTALTVDIPILGDTNLESDESFLVNLTNPYGAILTTSQSTINILNDDLTLVPTFAGISGNDIFTGGDANDIINGEGGDDSLNGGAGDDTLDGGSGKDVLTGGAGKDVFVYDNSTDSLFANPDRIRSFNPGEGDRLHLANNPTTIFNAGNISAANLTAAVIAVYADADPTAIGAQTLAANQAVFFSFGATSSTRRTYLSANDSNPGYNSGSDLFIEVTGIVGTLPSGSLASQSYFI